MDIETRDNIARWTNLTNEIAESWIREYFEIEEDEYVEIDWVANDVGTIFDFSGYFFDFTNVLDCYKHNITKEQLFNWYYFNVESQSVKISLVKYILSPQERKEAEEKHLLKLKEDVAFAEQEFKKALENYDNSNTY